MEIDIKPQWADPERELLGGEFTVKLDTKQQKLINKKGAEKFLKELKAKIEKALK